MSVATSPPFAPIAPGDTTPGATTPLATTPGTTSGTAPGLLPWRAARSASLRALAAGLIGLIGALGVLLYANTAYRVWFYFSPLTDFFAFRSWAAMLHASAHATDLYVPALVQAFLNTEIVHFPHHYPFAYPPSFLLMIYPLGRLPARVGSELWMLAGLGLYAGMLAEMPWRRAIAVGLLVLPATVLTTTGGQDGLIFAAFLAGACRVLPRRPVLAGVLFGLAACKPQFGVLVPVALLAAREWRAILAAIATVLASVLASGLAFGFDMWTTWPLSLLGLADFARESTRLSPLMPSVTANLRLLHMAPPLVLAGQILAGAVAAGCVWIVWRRGAGRLPAAVLLVGAFLATPYAFFYDLPILNAGLLAFVADRAARGRRLAPLELAAFVLALLLPVAMNAIGKGWLPALPLSLPVLAAVFALVVHRALRPEAALPLGRAAAGPLGRAAAGPLGRVAYGWTWRAAVGRFRPTASPSALSPFPTGTRCSSISPRSTRRMPTSCWSPPWCRGRSPGSPPRTSTAR